MAFETTEIAAHAQTALEGCEEGWRVVPARRPPPQSGAWTPSPSPRAPPPPKDTRRTLLTYDDMFE